MLLEIVPGEHLQEGVEILLDVLLRELALVDDVEPALQELGGHLQVGLLEQVVAQLEREEVVALTTQLGGDLPVQEGVQTLLVGHLAGGEGHLEELLVQLRIGELADLGDLHLELGVDALQLVLLHLKDGGALRSALVEFVHVHLHLVADLLAQERLALLLGHRDQTHVGVLHLHVAVVEGYGQSLVRLHALHVHQTAVAAQVVRAVVVVHLLVDPDRAVGQLILLRKLQFHGGGRTGLEHELELGIVLEIESALLLRRDHVAHVVDLLLLEVLEHGVRSRAVGLLGDHAFAVHLADDTHGNHARTETGNVRLALVVAQSLLNGLAVIAFAHRHLDEQRVLFALFFYDIHSNESVILFRIFA